MVRGDPALEKRLGERRSLFSATVESMRSARQGVDLDSESAVRGQGLVHAPTPRAPPRKHDAFIRADEWAAIHGCLERVPAYESIQHAWIVSEQLSRAKRSAQLVRVTRHALSRLGTVWSEHEREGYAH